MPSLRSSSATSGSAGVREKSWLSSQKSCSHHERPTVTQAVPRFGLVANASVFASVRGAGIVPRARAGTAPALDMRTTRTAAHLSLFPLPFLASPYPQTYLVVLEMSQTAPSFAKFARSLYLLLRAPRFFSSTALLPSASSWPHCSEEEASC